MNTNTIAHLPADRAPRMIDLTRSLRLPYGSLTPGIEHPEPVWRVEARQAGDECRKSSALIFGLFLAFFIGILGYYLLSK